MNSFKVRKLIIIIEDLINLQNECQENLKFSQTPQNALVSGGLDTSSAFVEHVLHFLEEAKSLCDELEFTSAGQKINLILIHLQHGNPQIDMSSLAAHLQNVKDVIMSACWNIQFIRIDSNLSNYVDNDSLFGEVVLRQFPGASEDIKSAGNCLAIELPTATVFHLMRVSEHGLRQLAKKLHVKVTDNKKLCPLEYTEWDKIIIAIKHKIDDKRSGLPKGPRRQAQIELYSEAADHCTFIKDIWRNSVSHTRRPYTQTEAISVFERIRDFMQFLAKVLNKQ
ncbi:MAG: hypothetical protein ABSG44_06625 [Thermodesulfobacteriota bacterium]|jgi:hypothetical protein